MTQTSQTMVFANGSAVALTYKEQSASDASHTDTVPGLPLKVDLTPLTRAVVVPNSLLFTLGNKTYYERAGSLFHSMNLTTGAGTAAGSIDFVTGVATITSWTGNAAPDFEIKAL